MLIDFYKDLYNLSITITAFQYTGDLSVRQASMCITKDQIDTMLKYDVYLPDVILKQLIKEMFDCKTDEDYNIIISTMDQKELYDMLLKLDLKFKLLDWHD